MATAFSQPRQFTPYVENWDKDLVLKALQYKQGKYDINRQKIQNTINSTMQIDLAKDEDAEYLYGKLKDTLDVVNQYGSGDLSLDSRTDYLQGHISSIADEKVMNGYLGTMKVRNIQKEAVEAKKNGLYSDDNFAYSMRDASRWLSDGTAGSEFNGNSSFVPYSDNNKKFLDVIKQLEPNAYAVRSLNGQYEYYKEGTVLSSATIKGAIELLMDSDPAAAKQMQVNAWAQFQGMDDATFFANSASTVNSLKAGTQEDIRQLTLERDKIGNLSNPKAQELQKLINLRTGQLDNIDKLSTNRTALENFIYKNNTINDYANTFAYSRTKQEVGANEVYFKQQNLDIERTKLNIELRSEGLKAMDQIRDVFNKQGESATRRLIKDYQNLGIPVPSFDDMVVGAALDQMTPGAIDIPKGKESQTLNEQRNLIAETKKTLDNDIQGVLVNLESQGLVNKSTYQKPILPSQTGDAYTTLPPFALLDTKSAIDYFRANGMETELVNRYDKLEHKQTQFSMMENTVANEVIKGVQNWFDTPIPVGGASYKKMGVGDLTVVEDNGQYYVFSSNEKPVAGQLPPAPEGYKYHRDFSGNKMYLAKQVPKELIPDLVKNKSLETLGDVRFNNQPDLKSADLATSAANILEQEWFPSMYPSAIIDVIGGDKGVGTESKYLASNLASYIVANPSAYGLETDSDDYKLMVQMRNPNSYDALIQNYTGKALDSEYNRTDGKVQIIFDTDKGGASLVIGDTPYLVTSDKLVNSPAAGIFGTMLADIDRKELIMAKQTQLLYGWDYSSVPYNTKPAETIKIQVGGPNNTVMVDLNVTANYNSANGKYKYTPSITYRGASNPININASKISEIYEQPLSELTFSTYEDAYKFITSRDKIVNQDFLIGAYNQYKPKTNNANR